MVRFLSLLVIVFPLWPALAFAEADAGGSSVTAQAVTTGTAPPGRLSLPELIQTVRQTYPGVHAAREALLAVQHRYTQAKWAWVPTGEITGLVAPAPEINCEENEDYCIRTDRLNINSFDFAGVMARIELKLSMPVYTFDKLGAAKRVAAADRRAKEAALDAAQDDIELNVVRAYWGLKLAREILYQIKDGRTYLDRAITRMEQEVDEGSGTATETDLLRLKTAAAEVDARTLEAQKLQNFTQATLAILVGAQEGSFDIDTEILTEYSESPAEVETYVLLAQGHRPETRQHAAAVDAAQARAEQRKAQFFPSLLLVSLFAGGVTTSVDNPHNAFFDNVFNFYRTEIGLALRWEFDLVGQHTQYKAAQAEARAAEAQRAAGASTIDLEVHRIYEDLTEARQRLEVAQKGQRAARSWLVATAQNLEAGLALASDLNDALIGYFQLKLKQLQAQFDINVAWAELARATGLARTRLTTAP